MSNYIKYLKDYLMDNFYFLFSVQEIIIIGDITSHHDIVLVTTNNQFRFQIANQQIVNVTGKEISITFINAINFAIKKYKENGDK